ncbi:MAG: ABC transporter ATP-binding protein [Fervidicoccaceae archaeon]
MAERKMIEEVFENKKDYLLMVEDLKVWFPIRRGITDIIRRKPQRYVRAVDSVSFFIKERETFCLAGESGCGKTTTGKSLLRLVPITAGMALFRARSETIESLRKMGVDVDGKDYVDIYSIPAKKMKPVRKDIQIVYQDPYGSLNPRYKIIDILSEPLNIHDFQLTQEEKVELVHKVLETVKLRPPEDFVERYPHQLSGGQRQRIAIAKAIIMNPKLVVADEPVSMLDASIRAEMLELLQTIKQERNLSYLFITHDLAVSRYICDRIAIMYLGRIVEMGETRRVIENPLHPYTRALVAAIPEPDPSNRHKLRDVPIKGEIPSAASIPLGCRFHPRCMAFDERYEALKDKCPVQDPPYFISDDGRIVNCWIYQNWRKREKGQEFL